MWRQVTLIKIRGTEQKALKTHTQEKTDSDTVCNPLYCYLHVKNVATVTEVARTSEGCLARHGVMASLEYQDKFASRKKETGQRYSAGWNDKAAKL